MTDAPAMYAHDQPWLARCALARCMHMTHHDWYAVHLRDVRVQTTVPPEDAAAFLALEPLPTDAVCWVHTAYVAHQITCGTKPTKGYYNNIYFNNTPCLK